jgi:hypothetical protein
MCFACEQEQMMAAYREYVARRKELLRAKAEGGTAATDAATDVAAAVGDDWAKGTWFAAVAAESDE